MSDIELNRQHVREPRGIATKDTRVLETMKEGMTIHNISNPRYYG